MGIVQLVVGSVLMFLGLALALAAVFRSLDNQWMWGWGVHELWILPLLAVVLLVAGGWLLP